MIILQINQYHDHNSCNKREIHNNGRKKERLLTRSGSRIRILISISTIEFTLHPPENLQKYQKTEIENNIISVCKMSKHIDHLREVAGILLI